MTIRELQKELLEEISSLVIEDNDNSIETRQKRALEIIKKLEGHINDDIEINGDLRITVLDCIVRCDSQNNIRLNNKSLINLENAIKNIGGKTSQELGREQNVERLQNISHEDISRFVEQLRRAREVLESSRKHTEGFIKFLDEQQKSNDASIKFCALTLPALFGALIGFGLAKGFGNDPILGLVVGALVGIAVVSVPLVLYLKKSSTSTSLENVATEQPNIQGQNI